jgi:hypothetical protein
MERVKLTHERRPWWWIFSRQPTRPGTGECPLNRRVKRIGLNYPLRFNELSNVRGKRDGLCSRKQYPFVGRAADGTWCCYADSADALSADPDFEDHRRDIEARLKNFREASELVSVRRDEHAKGKCSPGLAEKSCLHGESRGCCEGTNYPCLDEAAGECYSFGEEQGSEMHIPARGARAPLKVEPRAKRRRTDAHVTWK